MLKRVLMVIFIGIILLFSMFGMLIASKKTPAPHPLRDSIIVLDAGHGGVDCGAVGKLTGVREDVLNLQVTRHLKKLLEEAGVRVVMTRETDDGLYDSDTKLSWHKRQDMQRRVEIIKEANPDYVISIHMNAFKGTSSRGATVLYQSNSEQGKAFASCILQELKDGLDDGNRRDVMGGNYMVLRAAQAPSVIVECGFLSNPEEEMLLSSTDYQQKLAWHIYTGIMRYDAQVSTQPRPPLETALPAAEPSEKQDGED
ncbi:MAG: N-acetylmuramoyl-L-alanine amidase [Christensenellales bacterium]|jgi:N-acetylmuramoyl-L-alanine amidase